MTNESVKPINLIKMYQTPINWTENDFQLVEFEEWLENVKLEKD